MKKHNSQDSITTAEEEEEENGYESRGQGCTELIMTRSLENTDHGSSSRATTASDSLTSETNTSSDDDDDMDDESEEEDISKRIMFIKEKQTILKRASEFMKRSDAYEASIARQEPQQPQNEDELPPTIWDEAKDVLKELSKRVSSSSSRKQVKFMLSKRHNKGESPNRPFKKARIDLTLVEHVPSSTFGRAITKNGDKNEGVCYEEVELCGNGNNDRADSKPTDTDPTMDDWQIMVDSMTGSKMESPTFQADDTVKLEDALIITSVPQFIAQASPPFMVVHANSAFMSSPGLAKARVVGEPMEKFVQTTSGQQDFASRALAKATIHATLGSSSIGCKLQVKPVVTQNKDGFMSHLLVQVKHDLIFGAAGMDPSVAGATPACDNPVTKHLVGTVG